MANIGPDQALRERMFSLAGSDLTEFKQCFKRLRKLFPERAVEACLWYIASHGLDAASQSMAFWLSGEDAYVSVLIDPTRLPAEVAYKAVAALKEIDPQFFYKVAKATADLHSPVRILRVLSWVPAMVDYSILIPWLRTLSQSSDARVRSRSSKLLCELRPNKGLIERQMHSEDARVRANTIEALWPLHNEEVGAVFRAALADRNHRVVANAYVGLYLMGETAVLNEIIELCAHKDELFRAAMAWALGYLKDVRAMPALQELGRNDSSILVRQRALKSLLALESIVPDVCPRVPVLTTADSTSVEEEAALEESSQSEEATVNLFMFK